MTPPISFTDEQLKMLVQAARPLHPDDRSTFGGRRGTAGRRCNLRPYRADISARLTSGALFAFEMPLRRMRQVA